MIVASVMSAVLSASGFPKKELEIREVKPIFSDAGKYCLVLFSYYLRITKDVVFLGIIFAEEDVERQIGCLK